VFDAFEMFETFVAFEPFVRSEDVASELTATGVAGTTAAETVPAAMRATATIAKPTTGSDTLLKEDVLAASSELPPGRPDRWDCPDGKRMRGVAAACIING